MLARAWLVVVVLAACGGNSVRHLPDGAPPSDGAADSMGQSDAPPSATELTVTVGGAGGSGLTVYFLDPDSTLETTATTDASGTASGMLKTGGSVTIAVPAPPAAAEANADTLITWLGVVSGDHIYFAAAGAATSVTFTIPVDAVNAGSVKYTVSTTCGAGSIPVPVGAGPPPPTLTQPITLGSCSGPQDVMVVGIDGNGQAVSSFEVDNQTLTNDGTLDLSSQTYTAAQSRTYTWTDDSDDSTLEMQDTLQATIGAVYESVSLAAGGTPPTITRRAPVFGTDRDVVSANATVGTTGHTMIEWGQGTNYSGDWGAHRLPDITSAPAYDAATATISWNTTGGAVQPNLTEVGIAASRPADSEHAWNWTVLGDNGPITLPTLPTTLYDWNIGSADTFSGTLGLANVPGVAAEARAVLLGAHGEEAVETGTTGVVSTASYQPPQAQPAIVRLPFFRR
ncbi:MAG TPA: hypothetical protein VGL61_26745 [Kofleriaceae bacterium]|jgi:hypothetical protein